MTRRPTKRAFTFALGFIAFLAAFAAPRSAVANGADLPPEIVLQGFLKPEEGRVRLLVRVPLVLLSSFGLPKRGPGYLDLARMNDKLKEAAAASGQQIELFADGKALSPTIRDARISLLSDHSFASYSAALSHVEGPPLPADTELFWNQGFFDTELEYPLASPNPRLSLRVNVAPEMGARVKLRLEYQPVGEPARTYEIPGASGRIPLDPRWYETAWLFVKAGFVDAFAFDRFVFLVCLVAPFRQYRGVLAVVAILAAMQAMTLTAVAQGALAGVEVRWLPALFDTVLATTIVLVVIGNLAAPSLRVRWFIAAVIGALGGFGAGQLLADAAQFAGIHTLASVVFFNLGIALGEFVSLAVALVALRLLFASVLDPLLGVVVLSAVLGHLGWQWMLEGGHEFVHQIGHAAVAGVSSAMRVVALWMVPALLAGVAGCFLPRRFDGGPAPTLLGALRARASDERPAR